MRVECPWCGNHVELVHQTCPVCLHEVLQDHLNSEADEGKEGKTPEASLGEADFASIEEAIQFKFKCAKCGYTECRTKEVAMSGTGLSKLLDVEYNHYLFVSCEQCGFVEVYNPDVLRGHTSGQLSTVLDILFGG
ncbi:zinc ribbon domain-containing protein [Paenibacillus gansuensis]|uniref:Zinc ribbon domain-containing protein n=1 Tax=Paenibacillus gansuensis TaxID=306542 RepID=A0ABW5P785_9BACL